MLLVVGGEKKKPMPQSSKQEHQHHGQKHHRSHKEGGGQHTQPHHSPKQQQHRSQCNQTVRKGNVQLSTNSDKNFINLSTRIIAYADKGDFTNVEWDTLKTTLVQNSNSLSPKCLGSTIVVWYNDSSISSSRGNKMAASSESRDDASSNDTLFTQVLKILPPQCRECTEIDLPNGSYQVEQQQRPCPSQGNTSSSTRNNSISRNNNSNSSTAPTVASLEKDSNWSNVVAKAFSTSIVNNIQIHVPVHSSVGRGSFDCMTRWYQECSNTQIFRMFPNEDNMRSSRRNAPRVEAFGNTSWKKSSNTCWYQWSGLYTFVKARHGAVFQIKHSATYWSMQLVLAERSDGTLDLLYNKLRDSDARQTLVRDVQGRSCHVRVLDDGSRHKVFINEQLAVENEMSDRGDGANRFRWGLYSPGEPMDRDILIFVTGAQVKKIGSIAAYD